MKNKLLLTCFLVSLNLLAYSAIWVANNNPGAASGTNVFTGSLALQDALNNPTLANGDIIYVVPSQSTYGTVTITKEITVFGIGIKPIKDLANKSELFRINIEASNVRLSGLIIDEDVHLGINLSNLNISNITIENCRLGRVEMGSNNNVTVSSFLARNNVFEGSGSVASSFLLYVISNVTITNNIIFTNTQAPSMRVTGATITYNTFITNGLGAVDAGLNNNTFDHNIFYGVFVNLQASSSGNVWTNNLSFGSAQLVFGAGSVTNGTIADNIEDDDPLFTNVPITSTWNDAHDFTLLPGSPALSTSALNLTLEDMGPSGGATPFDAEGNLLPLIQSVTLPSIIPVNTDLPVTIKAKGN